MFAGPGGATRFLRSRGHSASPTALQAGSVSRREHRCKQGAARQAGQVQAGINRQNNGYTMVKALNQVHGMGELKVCTLVPCSWCCIQYG